MTNAEIAAYLGSMYVALTEHGPNDDTADSLKEALMIAEAHFCKLAMTDMSRDIKTIFDVLSEDDQTYN